MNKEPKCYIPVNDQKLEVSFEEDKRIAAFWNMQRMNANDAMDNHISINHMGINTNHAGAKPKKK